MIAAAIVNYRTADATLACVDALLACGDHDIRIFLLDNASGAAEQDRLRTFCMARQPAIVFVASETNLGFAGGTNRLLAEILSDPSIDAVILLNSDARAEPGFVAAMMEKLDPSRRIDFVAGKMLDEKDGSVDSLGITLFRSTLASNRKREDEILLGPSGGCALMTRRFLEDLKATHGEWFDELFFCYAEDTDMAARARWLGYRAAYTGDAVAHHARALSSGGPESDFVLYHGIRNSIWWLIKNAPLGWFLMSLPWFVALHVAIWVRHLRRGKARVLWALYRDAIKGISAMRRKRGVIMRTRRVAPAEFANWVEPHFYQRDYVRRAWRELFKSTPKG